MTAPLKLTAEAESNGPFVINLCSSTTPMALAQHQTPELKRFTFFVSRRRADGRDRFHLHMGHFATLAEAEEWVNVVRDIYPAAWAGEAPGKKLAQRAAAAAAPPVQVTPAPLAAVPHPVKPVEAVASTASLPKLPEAVRPAAPAVAPPTVPTLHAAPAGAPSAPKAAAPMTARAAAPEERAVSRPQAVPSPPKAAPAPAPAKPAALQGSNVREVLKSLDETGPTRMMPAPAVEPPVLSDTAVLKILEERRDDKSARGGEHAARGIEMLRPDDTGTVRALKEAVQDNQPVSFAVQLQWSVQPIDLAAVPPLAIFSAYTLYTVEGSRDGRKWYGLRLGFFGDAISAKQVASYVRSEFTTVAVIPVSTQERGRATDGDPKAAASAAAQRARKSAERREDEFKLIDDETDDIVSPGLLATQTQLKPSVAPKPVAKAAPIAKKKPLGRVRATEKRSAKSLEETLEILGASDLEIDNGRGELLNDSGVRHLRMEVQTQKNSPFSRLLERLTEKVKKA